MPIGTYRIDTDEQFLRMFSDKIARDYIIKAMDARRKVRAELMHAEFHRSIMQQAPHRWDLSSMICADCWLPYEKFAGRALANDLATCRKRFQVAPVVSTLVDLLLGREK